MKFKVLIMYNTSLRIELFGKYTEFAMLLPSFYKYFNFKISLNKLIKLEISVKI